MAKSSLSPAQKEFIGKRLIDVYDTGAVIVSGHCVSVEVARGLSKHIHALNKKRARLYGAPIQSVRENSAKFSSPEVAEDYIFRENKVCQAQGYIPIQMIDLSDGTFLLYEKSNKMPIARVNRMSYKDGTELGEATIKTSRRDSNRNLVYKLNKVFMKDI